MDLRKLVFVTIPELERLRALRPETTGYPSQQVIDDVFKANLAVHAADLFNVARLAFAMSNSLTTDDAQGLLIAFLKKEKDNTTRQLMRAMDEEVSMLRGQVDRLQRINEGMGEQAANQNRVIGGLTAAKGGADAVRP